MKKRILYALLFVSLIVLLDQSTKYLVRTYVEPFETIKIMPILNIVNVHNEGAAFGMFKGVGNTFFILISIAAIFVITWIMLTDKKNYRFFSLLAGGATGNLIDRIAFGYVIDFIDISVSGFHWPAFNVADSALTIGIFILIFKSVRKRD